MRILVLHDSPEDFKDWLEGECPLHRFAWACNEQEIRESLGQLMPEVVFSIKHSQFPGELHRTAFDWPSVKWFHVGGSGTEHLGSWDKGRVLVTNSKGILAPFHAERAMAALLAMSTGLLVQREHQQRAEWNPSRFETLQDKTMLIVGLGHTGLQLAQRAKGFGMTVLGVNRTGASLPYVDRVYAGEHLPELWPKADVVSLNVPLDPETRHLVDSAVFDRLQPGCLLLNASRGLVVDPQALENALRTDKLGGVWLDVTEPEPLPKESPLWTDPRVVITAHCADQVQDFPLRFARFFVSNLRRYEAAETMLNEVQPPH